MARLVRFEKSGPYRIDPADFPKDGKAIWICGCGLTATPPYCDKAHKACAQEQPGNVYVYRPGTTQVIEVRPDDQAPLGPPPPDNPS
jgi:CDGSH-type Zn-finger protein